MFCALEKSHGRSEMNAKRNKLIENSVRMSYLMKKILVNF